MLCWFYFKCLAIIWDDLEGIFSHYERNYILNLGILWFGSILQNEHKVLPPRTQYRVFLWLISSTHFKCFFDFFIAFHPTLAASFSQTALKAIPSSCVCKSDLSLARHHTHFSSLLTNSLNCSLHDLPWNKPNTPSKWRGCLYIKGIAALGRPASTPAQHPSPITTRRSVGFLSSFLLLSHRFPSTLLSALSQDSYETMQPSLLPRGSLQRAAFLTLWSIDILLPRRQPFGAQGKLGTRAI